MEFAEMLRDVDFNATNVSLETGGDSMKIQELHYFKSHPYVSWFFLILMIVTTVVGNVGNVMVSVFLSFCTLTNIPWDSLELRDYKIITEY